MKLKSKLAKQLEKVLNSVSIKAKVRYLKESSNTTFVNKKKLFKQQYDTTISAVDTLFKSYFEKNKDVIIEDQYFSNVNLTGFKDDIKYLTDGTLDEEGLNKFKERFEELDPELVLKVYMKEPLNAYKKYRDFDSKEEVTLTEEEINNNNAKLKNILAPTDYIPSSKADAKMYFEYTVDYFTEKDKSYKEILYLLLIKDELGTYAEQIKNTDIKKKGIFKLIASNVTLLLSLIAPIFGKLLKEKIPSITDLQKTVDEVEEYSTNYNENLVATEELSKEELDKALEESELLNKTILKGFPLESDILDNLPEGSAGGCPNTDEGIGKDYYINENCCLVPIDEDEDREETYVEFDIIEPCRTIEYFEWFVKPGQTLKSDTVVAKFRNYEGVLVTVYSPFESGYILPKIDFPDEFVKIIDDDFNHIIIANAIRGDQRDIILDIYRRFGKTISIQNDVRSIIFNHYGETVAPFIAYTKDYRYHEKHIKNIGKEKSSASIKKALKRVAKTKEDFVKGFDKKDFKKKIEDTKGNPDKLIAVKDLAMKDIDAFIYKTLPSIVRPIHELKHVHTYYYDDHRDIRNLSLTYYLDLIINVFIDLERYKDIKIESEELKDMFSTDLLKEYYTILFDIIIHRLNIEVDSTKNVHLALKDAYNTRIKDVMKQYKFKYTKQYGLDVIEKRMKDDENFDYVNFIKDRLGLNDEISIEGQTTVETLSAIHQLIYKIKDNLLVRPEGKWRKPSNTYMKNLIKEECKSIKDYFDKIFTIKEKMEGDYESVLKILTMPIFSFDEPIEFDYAGAHFYLHNVTNFDSYLNQSHAPKVDSEGNVIDEEDNNLIIEDGIPLTEEQRKIVDDEIGMYTEVPLTSYKYWVRHMGFDTLLSLPYLVTWLSLALIKIKLPVIYIPITVFRIKSVIFVVGIGFAGLGTFPMLFVCNLSTRASTLLAGLLLALDKIDKEFNKKISNIENSAFNTIKSYKAGDLSEFTAYANRLNGIVEKGNDIREGLLNISSKLNILEGQIIKDSEFNTTITRLNKISDNDIENEKN